MAFLMIAGFFVFIVGFSLRYILPVTKHEYKNILSFLKNIMIITSMVMISVGLFKGIFFYAEPGYIYHVRTIFGTEVVVNKTGYAARWFGVYEPWKKAMSVQIGQSGIKDKYSTSTNLPPYKILFLDQVDCDSSATVRFRIPSDKERFLKMAREYRTPVNLLNTILVPTVKETLSATSALMTAEDFFAGAKGEFRNEFRKQLQDGNYIVRREERMVKTSTKAKGTADITKGTEQKDYGEDTKTIYEVKKVLNSDGTFQVKKHMFHEFGIEVVDAIVTEMIPNKKFKNRMELKQQASADRAIAKEQRIQEEEQRLLAITKGEREVAERQAKMKVDQIEKTTKAETEKQLVIINAKKLKEKSLIEKEASQIKLEKAKIDAETIKTLADANAYEKEKLLLADNALDKKLQAYTEVQRYWAEAYANRKVPTNIFGSANSGQGSDTDTSIFQQMVNAKIATDIALNTKINKINN